MSVSSRCLPMIVMDQIGDACFVTPSVDSGTVIDIEKRRWVSLTCMVTGRRGNNGRESGRNGEGGSDRCNI